MSKKIILCVIILSFWVLPGCWDVLDISNRAFVMGIALDLGEGDVPYKVTVEIIKPTKQGENTSLVQTAEAENISQALKQIQARIAHPLSLSHLQLVLIGEKIAREKHFLDFVDFFQRNPDISYRLRLVMVQDAEAMDVLHTKPLLENYMTAKLVSMTRLNPYFSLPRNRSFYEFTRDLRSAKGRGLVTRVLSLDETDYVIRHGAAIYKEWKLVDWLSAEETHNANWLLGNMNSNVTADTAEGQYTYQEQKKSVKVTPIVEGDQVEFLVRVKTTGTLVQQEGHRIDVYDPEEIKQLEKLFSQAIRQEILSAIHKSQKVNRVDYLDFGGALNRSKPKVYNKLDWNEIYPNVPIRVEVESKMVRFGVAS